MPVLVGNIKKRIKIRHLKSRKSIAVINTINIASFGVKWDLSVGKILWLVLRANEQRELKNFLLATMCYSFKRISGSNQLTVAVRGVACFVVFNHLVAISLTIGINDFCGIIIEFSMANFVNFITLPEQNLKVFSNRSMRCRINIF